VVVVVADLEVSEVAGNAVVHYDIGREPDGQRLTMIASADRHHHETISLAVGQVRLDCHGVLVGS
jgi:hypothetical protein